MKTLAETERLPRRGAGWTTSAHLAVAGTGHEVDAAYAQRFADEADAKRAEQRTGRRTRLAAVVKRQADQHDQLRRLLSGDDMPPAVRSRARRIAHDLAQLHRELLPPDDGIQ